MEDLSLYLKICASVLLLSLVALTIWICLLKEAPQRNQLYFELSFFTLLLACLIISRYPYLSNNIELNPDEGQMIAQGMKYLKDFLPWRSVDGTTSGPLNTYVIMWPCLFGIKINYCTARLTGLVLIFLSLVLNQKLLAKIIGFQWSLVITLQAGFFYVTSNINDLVSYSSENLPVFFISLLLLASYHLCLNPKPFIAVVSGLVAGAIPFSKLQAIPEDVIIFFISAFYLLLKNRNFSMLKIATCYVLGLMTIPLIIITPVFCFGYINDFYIRYILENITYHNSNAFNLSDLIKLLFFSNTEFISCFLAVLLATSLISASIFYFSHILRSTVYGYITVAIIPIFLLLVSLYSIFRTGQPFGHYVHFIIFPLLLVESAFVYIFHQSSISTDSISIPCESLLQIQTTITTFIVFTTFLSISSFSIFNRYNHGVFDLKDDIVDFLKKSTHEGDTLAVWGWTPSLFVYSGLVPGTRDIIGHRVLTPGKHFYYFQKCFLEDITKSKPVYIIDTSNISYCNEWPADQAHEITSSQHIKLFLDNNYTDFGTINSLGKTGKLYKLKSTSGEFR